MGETGLGLGVLGPLVMSVDGAPAELGGRKQRAVLAMLALNRNRPVAIESLIEAVWDQSPVPAARVTIQSYVSNLRRLLGTAGLDPNRVLAKAPPGYRLNAADAECDAGRFDTQRIVGMQAAAAGQFEQASSHLAAALAEWRGPVLEDLRDFAFVERWATALTEDKLLAQVSRAEAEIACGRAHTIIGELEKLAAEHRHHEPLWAQLITAYYATKRQSDALATYRRLKAALAEDLAIDPDPAVSALEKMILRQEPLDTRHAAKTNAAQTLIRSSKRRTAPTTQLVLAGLRDTAGRRYPLKAATHIGRLADNDIVLSDADVSRHHATIIDTGTGFMIMDLQSANGVEVQGERIDLSAALAVGDHIRIGGHEFVFEVQFR
jgi:SARP family transcriptional regulator, regulator of embCAB operon